MSPRSRVSTTHGAIRSSGGGIRQHQGKANHPESMMLVLPAHPLNCGADDTTIASQTPDSAILPREPWAESVPHMHTHTQRTSDRAHIPYGVHKQEKMILPLKRRTEILIMPLH